jgi:hypothetical protein
MKGVKIVFSVEGEVVYVSPFNILTIISSVMALFLIAEYLLSYVYAHLCFIPESQRKMFSLYKYQDSEDISSLKDRSNVTEGE